MKLKIIEKGTHLVKLSDANNDIPSPPQVVADYLTNFEYYLREMVRKGGSSHDLTACQNHLAGLNESIMEATEQGWKLHLET
jgi:hypothetical protein